MKIIVLTVLLSAGVLGSFGCASKEKPFYPNKHNEKESLKAAAWETSRTEGYQQQVENNQRNAIIRNESLKNVRRY